MDADGDPDLCVTGYDGTDRIYRNDFTGNNWLHVELEGVTANLHGVGAVVRVIEGSSMQMQMVGSGNGYLSQNDLTLVFGLGSASDVDFVTVDWPGGGSDVFWNVAANQRLDIIQGSGATGIPDPPARVGEVRLVGNRPNPFNPTTTIIFDLSTRTRTEVAIYDVAGRLVTVLSDEVRPSGRHEVLWDGRDSQGNTVASGVYYVRLRAAGTVDSRSITLLK